MTASAAAASPADEGGAKHLIAGTRLPDIALAATRGASVNLARYQERAIVFVYPGGDGSEPEAEGFRDAYVDFELLGYEIFGLSGQASGAQAELAARAGIPYLLLSDENFAFADALGLPRLTTGVSYLSRLTMIVRNGVIYRVIHPIKSPADHARDLLGSLTSTLV